jgi:hypothetical protein
MVVFLCEEKACNRYPCRIIIEDRGKWDIFEPIPKYCPWISDTRANFKRVG